MMILISIYSGYAIFPYPSGGTERNVIIFAVDMSSSTKIDKRNKDILILGKSSTQGLEHTLVAEKMYLFNFNENNKNHNGLNSY